MNSPPNWATDKEFKNIYQGKKGVIIGRGLNEYGINASFENFQGIKIGCNAAYRVTKKLDALVWMDSEFFKRNWREIAQIDCLKFAVEPIHYPHYGVEIRGYQAKKPEKCAESFHQGFYPCNLSGYIALNIGLIMGLDPIWLYGFCPNTDTLKERSDSFRIIAEWAEIHNRKIYIANEESYLRRFFDYKQLPLKIKKKKSKNNKKRNVLDNKRVS